MGGPASSTRLFRLITASSFAAHPPEMPEPTTIASYARDGSSDRDTAIVSSRNDGSLDQALGHGFGGEVGEYREVLQHPEGALGAHRLPGEGCGLGRRRVRWWRVTIQLREQRLLLLRVDREERGAVERLTLDVDRCEPRKEPIPVALEHRLGEEQIDEAGLAAIDVKSKSLHGAAFLSI